MKKTGLIALAMVLALGIGGVGLGWWSETLTIDGEAETGELDVGLKAYVGVELSPYVTLSPWFDYWGGSGQYTHHFTLNGVYPSFGSGGLFSGHFFFLMYTARNYGTIPAKVASVNIDAPDWLEVNTYSEGVPAEVKEKAIAEVENSAEIPEEEKAEIIEAIADDWSVGDILGTTRRTHRTAVLFITLHVLENAPENGTGDVTVTTLFTQFNAP